MGMWSVSVGLTEGLRVVRPGLICRTRMDLPFKEGMAMVEASHGAMA